MRIVEVIDKREKATATATEKTNEMNDDVSFKITPKIEKLLVRIAENNFASINEMNLLFTSNGHVYRVLRGLLDIGILSVISTCS